jgi:predicted RecB family nuclease
LQTPLSHTEKHELQNTKQTVTILKYNFPTVYFLNSTLKLTRRIVPLQRRRRPFSANCISIFHCREDSEIVHATNGSVRRLCSFFGRQPRPETTVTFRVDRDVSCGKNRESGAPGKAQGRRY